MTKKADPQLLDETKGLLSDIDDALEGSRQVIMRARMDSLFVGEEAPLTDEELEELHTRPSASGCSSECRAENGPWHPEESIDVPYGITLISRAEGLMTNYRTSIFHPLFHVIYDEGDDEGVFRGTNNLDALAYQSAVHGEPARVRMSNYSNPAVPLTEESWRALWSEEQRRYYDERLKYYEQRLDLARPDGAEVIAASECIGPEQGVT